MTGCNSGHLDAVVLAVRDEQVAMVIGCHARGLPELPLSVPVAAELAQRAPVALPRDVHAAQPCIKVKLSLPPP